jgi:hypothetical protein
MFLPLRQVILNKGRNCSADWEESPILRFVWVLRTHTNLKIGAHSHQFEQLLKTFMKQVNPFSKGEEYGTNSFLAREKNQRSNQR